MQIHPYRPKGSMRKLRLFAGRLKHSDITTESAFVVSTMRCDAYVNDLDWQKPNNDDDGFYYFKQ